MRFLVLTLAALSCQPEQVERIIMASPAFMTCTLTACLPKTVCGPIVEGRQLCHEEQWQCNTCTPGPSEISVCVPEG